MTVRTTILSLCTAVAVVACSGAAIAQTNPLKLIKGTITDSKTGKSIDGGKLNVYQGSTAETVSSSKINPRTGFYQLILSPNTEYRFEVVSPKYYTTNFTIKTAPGSNYEETVKDLKVDPIPMGTVIYAGRVFEPGASAITDPTALKPIVDALKKQQAIAVTVTVIPELAAKKPAAAKKPKKGKKGGDMATVSDVPTTDAGATLGEARVSALKNFFKGQGISTTRLMWDLKSPIPAPAAKTKGPDNVVIKITSIQDEEESDG
jgi:hypothetical protein